MKIEFGRYKITMDNENVNRFYLILISPFLGFWVGFMTSLTLLFGKREKNENRTD